MVEDLIRIIDALMEQGPLDLTQIAGNTLILDRDELQKKLDNLEKNRLVISYYERDSHQIVYRLF